MKCCRLYPAIAFLGLLLVAPGVQAKKIRLQNETVDTDKTPGASAASHGALPGLAIVQFKTSPSLELRRDLESHGIDLLAAVPEDAFVTRIRGADRAWLQSLDAVEWVGPYKPEHKTHQGVSKAAQAPGDAMNVKVLVAPGASNTEKAEVRGSLESVGQESALPMGTILQGRLNLARLAALQRSDAVLWIEPARDMKLMDEVASKLVAGDAGPNFLYTQSLGYDGGGVTVAVADSGLDNGDAATMHPDLLGRTPAFFYYGLPGQLEDAADEHSHGTHVAGIIAGNGATSEVDENGFLYGLGVAPGASIIAQRLFDGVGNYAAPPSFEKMTRDAKRAGADIGSNSWGDDTGGAYDLSAAEFDALVRDCDALMPGDQPYILEFSAGNAGPIEGSIGSPAVGKNVIATGASQNDRTEFLIYGDGPETMADFSSRGPCRDGRIKPDIVAPGTYIASLQSASATDEYAWAPISGYYQYQGGTSQAGPHASGAAAVFVQYWRQTRGATPSPAVVKAALINSAVDLFDEFGTASVPNMDEGWGRLDLTTLFDSSLQYEYVDQETPLANSETFEKRIVVSGAEDALKVTMAYTDVPAVPSAAIALVNDLDLEVIAPDGTIYRGNQFLEGESAPNAAQADRINNVEGVLINLPVAGEYVVRVRAHSVLSEARLDTDPIDQDFALVVSGKFADLREGVLSMDRDVYRSPDTIKLFLADKDLAGSPTAAIKLSSAVEPAGEQILLHANGSHGAFTGAVLTATGPASLDGKLQVAHGNVVTASYLDASSAISRTDQATVDLIAPVLSSATFQVLFASPQISWTSSEPALSVVQFGTSKTSLTGAKTNAELTTSHSVSLGKVIAGVTYYYRVLGADAAGNWSTNDNNGAFYSFTVNSLKPLLLVDAWPEGSTPTTLPGPPLGGYTNALNQLGIEYDVWDASAGSPMAVLPSYRCVIWHFDELAGSWTAAERTAISNYLHSGGSMMIASMEVLSRVTDTNYHEGVLHVQDFLSDEQGSDGVEEITGEELDPVISGFSAVLNYEVYDELWAEYGGFLPSDISDTIFPDNEASTLFFDEDGDAVGLRWPGLGRNAPGRLVLLVFPLDAVPMDGTPNGRVALLERIMAFLIPGASRNATLQFQAAAYQSPGTAFVELGDSDLAGQASINLTVRSSSDPAGVPVTLAAFGPGQFSGSVELASSSGSGKLRALHGDTLTISYTDASAGVTRTATAAVDNVPPVISGVEAEADYVDAVIYWDTSEPADSLVLFGDSPLLGRSAYTASLETGHGMVLSGLVPERTYYYKVFSRDSGGNLAQSGTNLLQFSTKVPLHTPWSDNMDTGATNWTTFTDSESFGIGGGDWSLGVPDNGAETQAHSPPHCWGSNLQGDYRDFSECLLISPAIYLPQGKVSTLSFWHSYDFYDYSGFDLEFGFVQISVNNGPLQDLTSYFDSSFGWEQETVDLTPFAGNMVFLVWHYALIGFESGPRPGWLVDDVSFTSQAYTGGVIRITNNIWQAEFVLGGPVSKAGSGPLTVISNAPPGDYTLEFADVPYYQTPPPQTNITLAAGASLNLSGNYTFADANQNGISDAWEMAFFKSVSANRTSLVDSDGDTMTDFEEFVVGTDPTGSSRPFVLSSARQAGQSLRLEWPSKPGETYTIQTSTNLASWIQTLSPIQATSTVSAAAVPITASPRSFFRVTAAQSAAPSTLPESLRLQIEKVPGGGVRLTWRSPNRCGFRVEASTDLNAWTPVSSWIRANARTTTYTVPGSSALRTYYRVRAEP